MWMNFESGNGGALQVMLEFQDKPLHLVEFGKVLLMKNMNFRSLKQSSSRESLRKICNLLAKSLGCYILSLVPSEVSTCFGRDWVTINKKHVYVRYCHSFCSR